MSDIQSWAKDLKHNKKTANKYKGVKTVEDILRLARKDGYTFTERELVDFNFDSIAGGDLNFGLDFDFGDKFFTNNENTNIKQSTTNTTQNATVNGNHNTITYSSNTDVNQNN